VVVNLRYSNGGKGTQDEEKIVSDLIDGHPVGHWNHFVV
jgi:hypothetical protein